LVLWKTLQGRKSRFEAGVPPGGDWEWRRLPFTENIGELGPVVPGASLREDEIVSVVFPRVFTVKGGYITPVFPGVVVTKSQTTDAQREVEKFRLEASSPLFGRSQSTKATRQRKFSLASPVSNGSSNTNGGSFLGSGASSGH